MDNKIIKWIGLGATLLGAAASIAGSWASEKQQDQKIEEKITKALSEMKKD